MEQVSSNQNDEVRRLRLVSGYWHSPISDYKEPMYSEYVEAKHYDALRAEAERLRAALLAIEEVEPWDHRASEYFQMKHKLADTLAELRASLNGASGVAPAERKP